MTAGPIVSDTLADLQALMRRSVATAGAASAAAVASPDRQMTAVELVALWPSLRLVAVATVDGSGRPHLAPVHAELDGTTVRMACFADALRRRDIAVNPHVALTTWAPDGSVVVLYGRGREVTGSEREVRPGGRGPRRIVTIEVELSRVYAMRSPAAPSGSARSS